MQLKSIILATISIFLFSCTHEDKAHNAFDTIYHGSNNKNIQVIIPKSDHVRDKNEGVVTFATPSITLASCYLFRWNDSWVNQSIFKQQDSYKVVMVISDRKKFNQLDNGGAIYILPAKNFQYDKNKGLGIYEWTSRKPVIPFAQISFASALEAMQKFGVKVYFTNKKQFENYITSPDREKFLSDLK